MEALPPKRLPYADPEVLRDLAELLDGEDAEHDNSLIVKVMNYLEAAAQTIEEDSTYRFVWEHMWGSRKKWPDKRRLLADIIGGRQEPALLIHPESPRFDSIKCGKTRALLIEFPSYPPRGLLLIAKIDDSEYIEAMITNAELLCNPDAEEGAFWLVSFELVQQQERRRNRICRLRQLQREYNLLKQKCQS